MIPFKNIPKYERDKYEVSARNLVYPDVRPTYKRDADIIRTLARAIYKCEQMASAGTISDGTTYHQVRCNIWESGR